MAVHDLFADRQSDAGAGILLAPVQAVKYDEDALEIPGADADAIVPNAEHILAEIHLRADLYARRRPAMKLDRVADQILEQLRELAGVGDEFRQRIERYLGARFRDRHPQIAERALD